MSTPTVSRGAELDTWVRFLRAHSAIVGKLNAELVADHGLTINDFEALMHLYRADEYRLRRVDLVERLMLTPSGVTRLLDGLQETGLVENVHCESDARVTWARLTKDGIETLECVGVNHEKRLRALVRETLSENEVEQLS